MRALTAQNVENTLRACLMDDGDERIEQAQRALKEKQPLPDSIVIVECVMMTIALDRAKVDARKKEIGEMLSQLPEQFMADSTSKGWSFLQACMTRSGEQWGEHTNIDELLALGFASGQAKFLLPREAWCVLPGGMPYFVVEIAP